MMINRDAFSSRIGFVLAAAGSAVGLGNIWKLPFEVGRSGGAAFVVIYLLFCFVLCYPVIVAEIAIGRKTQLNPVGAFKALGFPRWKGVGLLGVFCGVLILSYYSVIAGWAFAYFFEMVQANFAIGSQFELFTADWIKVGLYAAIFMSMTSWVVAKGISGGIERATKILMPALLITILGLFAYGLTLLHALEGLKFYLVPDFSAISGSVIYSALGQVFFLLITWNGGIDYIWKLFVTSGKYREFCGDDNTCRCWHCVYCGADDFSFSV